MIDSRPNLDVLRSCAVLMVVGSHIAMRLGLSLPGFHFGALGLLGVIIFFVHTALVLCLSMDREGSRAFAPFMVRRVFRIYPLSVVVVLLLAFFTPGGREMSSADVWSNLLLVQNMTGALSLPPQLWTLPYELQMYIVLPVLAGVAFMRRPIFWALMAWLIAVCVVVVAAAFQLNYLLIKFAPCFVPGIAAYVLMKRYPPTLPASCLPVLVVALVLLYPAAVAAGIYETVLSWLVCLMLGLVLPLIREVRQPQVMKAANVVATYSYSIYLVHDTLLEAIVSDGAGPLAVRLLLFIAATAAVSFFAYHAVERPGIQLGRRLASRMVRLRSVAGAGA